MCWIKTIAAEVFKSLTNLNPKILFQQKFQHGKNILKYYDAYIWNILPNDAKNSTMIDNINLLLKAWEGSKCQSVMCNILK